MTLYLSKLMYTYIFQAQKTQIARSLKKDVLEVRACQHILGLCMILKETLSM